MKTDNNFVRSGHARVKDDNYQTVDPRCVKALIETINIPKTKAIVDCCSPNGSGILQSLSDFEYKNLTGLDLYYQNAWCDWNIFNPPYERNLVDKIILTQIDNLNGGMTKDGVACLLRTGFDHAKTRKPIFKDCKHYAGQIKMLFRPVWFLDTDTTPIHNYVWHIWMKDWCKPPTVWYW